jgi:hypothetical protein
MTLANYTIQRMRASRCAQLRFGRQWRLARTADGDRWTCMRTFLSKMSCLLVTLIMTGSLLEGRAATPTITYREQEVVEALLQQDVAGQISKRLVVEDTASIQFVRFGHSYEKFAVGLRQQASGRGPAFNEALEDFLRKNKNDTRIIFPTNAPAKVELVSEAVVKEIFSAKHDAKPNGWDVFYQRFPGSSGLITISRAGIDSKGTMAIIYFGKQSHYLAGSGRIRVLKHEGKKWVLCDDRIGPEWVS